jgi:hypothetical protein
MSEGESQRVESDVREREIRKRKNGKEKRELGLEKYFKSEKEKRKKEGGR